MRYSKGSSSINRYASERRGVVLAVALVFFLLCTAILCTLLQGVINHERHVRDHRQLDQARWLADAGIDRALAQVRQSGAYHGETWKVSADELGGISDGKVTITVQAVDEHPDEFRVIAQADYPDDDVHRVRQSRETTVLLKSPEKLQ
jgi:type II secretory pathway component PulK